MSNLNTQTNACAYAAKRCDPKVGQDSIRLSLRPGPEGPSYNYGGWPESSQELIAPENRPKTVKWDTAPIQWPYEVGTRPHESPGGTNPAGAKLQLPQRGIRTPHVLKNMKRPPLEAVACNTHPFPGHSQAPTDAITCRQADGALYRKKLWPLPLRPAVSSLCASWPSYRALSFSRRR